MPYFFNTENNESRWEPPSELSEKDIKSLPGAKYLNTSSQSRAESAPAGQVRASHLLVKHRGSRRPASWKEVCNTLNSTIPREKNHYL